MRSGSFGGVCASGVAYVSDQFRLRANREFEQMGLHEPGTSQRPRFVNQFEAPLPEMWGLARGSANSRRPTANRRVGDTDMDEAVLNRSLGPRFC